MGSLYKTSQPGSIDFMYKLPEQAMLSAITANDTAIDNQYQQVAFLNDKLLNIKFLEPDKEAVQKYIDEYQQKIDALTKTLQGNLMDWRKQMPVIKDLGRQLDNDFLRGNIGAIQGNYNVFQTWDAKEKARIGAKDNGITPEQYQISRAKFLEDFKNKGGTKYDPMTKSGNTITTEDLYANQDIMAEIQKYMKDSIADKKAWFNPHIGQFVYGVEGSDEYKTQEDVVREATAAALANQNIVGHVRQGQRLGYASGYTEKDANGNEQVIQPYTYDEKGRMVLNPKSFLYQPLAAASGIYGFNKHEEKGSAISANAFELQKQKAALDDANDAAKYKREHPEVNTTPLTFEMQEQIMDPKEFTPDNLRATVAKYEAKAPTTGIEWTEYNNAKDALDNIQKAATTYLKKQGFSDAEIIRAMPYAYDLSKKLEGPSTYYDLPGTPTKPVPAYNKALWKMVTRTGNDGTIIHTFEPTSQLQQIQDINKKLKGKYEGLTKAIAESNITKIPYFAIDPTVPSGKVMFDIGINLANMTKDADFYNDKDNPEWNSLGLRFDTQGTFWSSKGKIFSNDEQKIDTPAKMSKYLIPVASTPKGEGYIVQYKIDKDKLAADGLVVESSKGNMPETIKIVYNKTNANKLVEEVIKSREPSVQKVLNRSNPQNMYIIQQNSQQLKNLESGEQIPVSYPLVANSDNYMAKVITNTPEVAIYEIEDRRNGVVRHYEIKAYRDETTGQLVPVSSDALNSKMISDAEILNNHELLLKEKENKDFTIKKK